MQVTANNSADAEKKRQQKIKQAKVISTRNVIPTGRPVTKEDVQKFIDKRNKLLNGESIEEIKPEAAQVPEVDDYSASSVDLSSEKPEDAAQSEINEPVIIDKPETANNLDPEIVETAHSEAIDNKEPKLKKTRARKKKDA